jgi:adenine phosphoribosyltransferase
LIAGMEARGFIFGAAVAARMGVGFVPVRKPGKLPVATIGIDYALEYGATGWKSIHGIREGQRVVIVDDLIATGGTALAAAELLRQAGAVVHHALFVIDLPDLGGAERLRGAGVTVDALMDFRALKRESPALRRERGLCAYRLFRRSIDQHQRVERHDAFAHRVQDHRIEVDFADRGLGAQHLPHLDDQRASAATSSAGDPR